MPDNATKREHSPRSLVKRSKSSHGSMFEPIYGACELGPDNATNASHSPRLFVKKDTKALGVIVNMR